MTTRTQPVECCAYTAAGRVYGYVNSSTGGSLTDHCNRPNDSVLIIEQARMVQRGFDEPPRPAEVFTTAAQCSLPKASILWLTSPRYRSAEVAPHRSVRFAFAFADHCLIGDFRVPSSIAPIDALQNMLENKPFQSLQQVSLDIPVLGERLGENQPLREIEQVTINLAQVLNAWPFEASSRPYGRGSR